MGFGSYDESEQKDQSVEEDEDSEGINVHQHEHDGQVTVEGGDSDELLDQLETIKASDDGDDDE